MGRIADKALEIAEEKFIASSGPGGQNVNKVATAVQLRVDVFQLGMPPDAFGRLKDIAGSKLTKGGEIVLTANEYRTQEQNREAARERLLALLDEGRARHPRHPLSDLPAAEPGPDLSGVLSELRAAERY